MSYNGEPPFFSVALCPLVPSLGPFNWSMCHSWLSETCMVEYWWHHLLLGPALASLSFIRNTGSAILFDVKPFMLQHIHIISI